MKANIAPLLNLFSEKNGICYSIPIYQRRYAWEGKNFERLWNDILKVGGKPHGSCHFTGAITYVVHPSNASSQVREAVIIDGQQRVTTFFLLLKALHNELSFLPSKDLEETLKISTINDKYLHLSVNNSKHLRLRLTDGDDVEFSDIMRNGKAPINGGNLSNAYNYFVNKIKETKKNPEQINVVIKGIQRLCVVDVSLDQADNPQEIFESMNSTGKSLTQADLIRNYMLMQLSGEEQKRLYRDIWRPLESAFGDKNFANDFNDFIWYYLTVKTLEIPDKNNIYGAFRDFYSSSPYSIEELMKDMLIYAQHFATIMYAKIDDSRYKDDVKFIEAFQDIIRRMKIKLLLPVLLKIFADYKSELYDFSAHEALECIRLVESYYVRRHVLGLSASNMNLGFADLMVNIDTNNYRNSFVKEITGKTNKSRYFPRDEEFVENLTSDDLFDRKLVKYILDRIANWKSANPQDFVNNKSVTVEHVMPQTENLNEDWIDMLGPDYREVQAEYLHRLGNLTLTYYNSEYGAKRFIDKLNLGKNFLNLNASNGDTSKTARNIGLAYATALEYLNEEFIDELRFSEPSWTKEKIEARGQRLARAAVQIWSLPSDAELPTMTVKEPSAKQRHKTTLADLGNSKMLQFPIDIYPIISRYSCVKAQIVSPEKIIVNSIEYSSLSTSAGAAKEFITNKPASVNGWEFWGVKQIDDTLKPLSEYRAQLESANTQND